MTYHLRPARYAKGKIAVTCPSDDGYKTRAACLAERLSNGRYTHREHAYIMTPAASKRFETLYAQGWDACVVTGKLIPPATE